MTQQEQPAPSLQPPNITLVKKSLWSKFTFDELLPIDRRHIYSVSVHSERIIQTSFVKCPNEEFIKKIRLNVHEDERS